MRQAAIALLIICFAAVLPACSNNCGCPSPCASPCVPGSGAYGAQPAYVTPSTGSPSYGGTQPYAGGTGTPQVGNVVTVQNHAYYPATLTVSAGTMVRWVNRDSVAHSATGNGFDDELPAGGEGSYTFGMAGTYDVHCRYHERMRGQVVVR